MLIDVKGRDSIEEGGVLEGMDTRCDNDGASHGV